jgi:predicted RNA-binding protein with PIN domain
MPRLVVDGSNVMGARPDGWWRDREGARTRLTVQLDVAADAVCAALLDDPAADVVVVHDGPAFEIQVLRVVVRFAGHADDLITALAAPGDVVVTSDRELVGRVAARGATAVGARRLLRLLDDPA